jgi:hypothetical protein
VGCVLHSGGRREPTSDPGGCSCAAYTASSITACATAAACTAAATCTAAASARGLRFAGWRAAWGRGAPDAEARARLEVGIAVVVEAIQTLTTQRIAQAGLTAMEGAAGTGFEVAIQARQGEPWITRRITQRRRCTNGHRGQ